MQLVIYQPSGNIRAFVYPSESSEETCELMGQDVFNLSFASPVPVHFEYADYVIIHGRKFRLNAPETVTKNANRQYEYSAVFDSNTQQIGKPLYLFLDQNNRFTKGTFSLTATPIEFLNLLIYNLERIYPNAGYKIGYVLDAPPLTIDFAGNNCLEVLNILADKFGTEWLIEGVNDEKISLYKKQSNSGLILRYGKSNGLEELTIQPQNNANPITRVYGYGSNRNLGSNYRGGSDRLRMAGSLYLEKNTGLQTGTGPYDVVEVEKIFENIYPRRNGVISSVSTPFIFSDSSMDFDVNGYLMPGVTAKVEFTSGLLAGRSFEISNYENGSKTFTILENTEEQTLEIPSALLPPQIGDKYVLIDILMPDVYVKNAEAELRQAVQDYLDQVSGEVPRQFEVICDPFYFQNTGKSFQLGQTATIQDDFLDINKQIRIIGYVRNWRYPYMYKLKLAETVKESAIIKLINP